MPELVGVGHCADRLDPSIEYVKRPGVEDLAVPVAEDCAWLAVHLLRLPRHVDPEVATCLPYPRARRDRRVEREEPREDRGKHPGYLLGAEDGPGQLWGLAAAVADQRCVGGEQLSQPVEVAFPERVEQPCRQFLALPAVRLEPRAPREE